MKIIQGLKKIQDLQRKASDLMEKVQKHSAYLSNEQPVYQDQMTVVKGWVQAYSDILKEILGLRIRIQKTNLATSVTMEFPRATSPVTKTIAEWIHRRRDLAYSEASIWQAMGMGKRAGVVW